VGKGASKISLTHPMKRVGFVFHPIISGALSFNDWRFQTDIDFISRGEKDEHRDGKRNQQNSPDQ
jgi:hypothetical protein